MTPLWFRRFAFSFFSAQLVILAGPPNDVSAQPADAGKSEARDRFDRGLKLFNDGDNAGALAEFRRAYELIPNSLVLYNIGLVYAAMGRPVDASDALDKVLKEPGTLSGERLTRAKQVRDEQALRVAQVAVTTSVPASIEIDNVEAGKTPLSAPIRLASGTRVIGAIAPGYAPVRKEITVAGGTKSELKLELVPMEGRLSHLTVKTHLPAAEVLVDGHLVGTTPLASSLTLPPGDHAIELKRGGYAPARQSLHLGDGASGEVTLEPEEDREAIRREGGTLQLEISETQAVVTVDGKSRGVDAKSVQLAKGPHRLLVERGGFEPFERDITVEPSRSATVPVILDPTPDTRAAFVGKASAQRTWGWVTVAAGGALLAGGGTLFVLNQSKKNDTQEAYDVAAAQSTNMTPGTVCDTHSLGGDADACNAMVLQKYDALQNAKRNSNVALIVAGVGLAVTSVGVFIVASGESPHKYDRGRPGSDAARVRLLPTLSWSGSAGAVGLVGTF